MAMVGSGGVKAFFARPSENQPTNGQKRSTTPFVPVAPSTAPTSPVIVPEVLALMAFEMAVMSVPPAIHWPIHTRRINRRHIHHAGWRWRGVNHTGRRAINDRAGYPYLGVHREMADPGVHRNRGLDHHRMGATHLCNAQAQQAEQRDGS